MRLSLTHQKIPNMKTKIAYWRLETGRHKGQESLEMKRGEGEKYIEKLKADGENVIEVIDEGKGLRIVMEDK